jgi:hypothetical protein
MSGSMDQNLMITGHGGAMREKEENLPTTLLELSDNPCTHRENGGCDTLVNEPKGQFISAREHSPPPTPSNNQAHFDQFSSQTKSPTAIQHTFSCNHSTNHCNASSLTYRSNSLPPDNISQENYCHGGSSKSNVSKSACSDKEENTISVIAPQNGYAVNSESDDHVGFVESEQSLTGHNQRIPIEILSHENDLRGNMPMETQPAQRHDEVAGGVYAVSQPLGSDTLLFGKTFFPPLHLFQLSLRINLS